MPALQWTSAFSIALTSAEVAKKGVFDAKIDQMASEDLLGPGQQAVCILHQGLGLAGGEHSPSAQDVQLAFGLERRLGIIEVQGNVGELLLIALVYLNWDGCCYGLQKQDLYFAIFRTASCCNLRKHYLKDAGITGDTSCPI